MTLLTHKAIVNEVSVEAFKPVGPSKRGLRGMELKTCGV